MPGFRSRRRALASTCAGFAILAGIATSGCSGAGPSLPTVGSLGGGNAPYVESNIFSPVGYNAKQIDDTHYLVRADGVAATPPHRLERMAQTRAPELGKELGFAWYKVESSDVGVTCGKRVEGYKGAGAAHNDIRTHKLTVAYAKTQVDPSYQPVDAGLAAAKAALDADAASPEEAAASEAELKRACDKR